MSAFGDVEMLPPDGIYGIAANAKADPDVVANLVIGAYRDEEGKPFILPSVGAAKEGRAADPTVIHEYLPIRGNAEFAAAAAGLILGPDSPAGGRTASVQALSGTGALRVLAEFVANVLPEGTSVYLSDPSWGNHVKVLGKAGLPVVRYRYYDSETCGLDFAGMCEDLEAAPEGSVVLLHMCAHNPSGVDPSLEQWEAVAEICARKSLLPWFDAAYQGFASGDPDADAASLRLFVAKGLPCLLAQSFAKNAGLYGERIGAAHIVASSPEEVPALYSQLEAIIRPMYSSPPRYFADIVLALLTQPELNAAWHQDLKTMSSRIADMRQALFDALAQHNAPGDWSHILNQIGMFSYTGLTKTQCQALMDDHHVYLLTSGRISMSGLNPSNVSAVAAAIAAVVRDHPSSD